MNNINPLNVLLLLSSMAKDEQIHTIDFIPYFICMFGHSTIVREMTFIKEKKSLLQIFLMKICVVNTRDL